jgi:hypothetical protein
MSDPKDDIQKLQKEAAAAVAEAERLSKMTAAIPDLKKYVGRWNKVAYYSKSFNDKVTAYDMRHNCGCCNDSPLEIWPYAETEHGKIYSDPPSFRVGERHWISGDKPYAGWKKEMRAANIPENIIERVTFHFQKDREDRIACASEEDDDYSEVDE